MSVLLAVSVTVLAAVTKVVSPIVMSEALSETSEPETDAVLFIESAVVAFNEAVPLDDATDDELVMVMLLPVNEAPLLPETEAAPLMVRSAEAVTDAVLLALIDWSAIETLLPERLTSAPVVDPVPETDKS